MLISDLIRTSILLSLFACSSQDDILESVATLEARQPNVLYILADDLGYGEVGCYGQDKIRTPHIDRLAQDGMRFTQHYSGSPVCAPSRCVLLTGLHTGHAVVRSNWERGGWSQDAPEGQYPLPEGTLTLARELQTAGYETSFVGKWGLGGPATTGHPNKHGFDHFYGILCQRLAHNYYPDHLWRNSERVDLEGNEYFSAHQKLDTPLGSNEEYWERYSGATYAPDELIDEAERFIRGVEGKPFFLLFASPVPHVSLQVPPEDLAEYPESWDSEPYLGQRGYLPHPSPRRAYAALVTRFDRDIGRLLSLLDELEIAGDTIVMFSSDNGPTFNGGTDSTFFESTAGLNGLKCSVLEGGLRVPFLVRWPEHIQAGAVTEFACGFQDVLPTILELVGAPGVDDLDGLSLAPVLLGNGMQPEHETLYWEYNGQQALRMGDWKLVRRRLKSGSSKAELYNLKLDRGEAKDLASDYPEQVRELTRRMDSEHVPSSAFPLLLIDSESD